MAVDLSITQAPAAVTLPQQPFTQFHLPFEVSVHFASNTGAAINACVKAFLLTPDQLACADTWLPQCHRHHDPTDQHLLNSVATGELVLQETDIPSVTSRGSIYTALHKFEFPKLAFTQPTQGWPGFLTFYLDLPAGQGSHTCAYTILSIPIVVCRPNDNTDHHSAVDLLWKASLPPRPPKTPMVAPLCSFTQFCTYVVEKLQNEIQIARRLTPVDLMVLAHRAGFFFSSSSSRLSTSSTAVAADVVAANVVATATTFSVAAASSAGTSATSFNTGGDGGVGREKARIPGAMATMMMEDDDDDDEEEDQSMADVAGAGVQAKQRLREESDGAMVSMIRPRSYPEMTTATYDMPVGGIAGGPTSAIEIGGLAKYLVSIQALLKVLRPYYDRKSSPQIICGLAVGRTESESLLADHPPGTFVLRFGCEPGTLVISAVSTCSRVIHYKVTLQQLSRASLPDVILACDPALFLLDCTTGQRHPREKVLGNGYDALDGIQQVLGAQYSACATSRPARSQQRDNFGAIRNRAPCKVEDGMEACQLPNQTVSVPFWNHCPELNQQQQQQYPTAAAARRDPSVKCQ